jgi:hypothetical protein
MASAGSSVVVAGAASGPAFYTAKYATQDGTLLWERRSEGVEARAVCADSNGNVIVTGRSSFLGGGEVSRTIKYAASDGAVLWEPDQGGNAVAADPNGNIVVTGSRTTKFAAEDGELLWEQEQGGLAVAVDLIANVVVGNGSGFTKYAGEDGAVLWGINAPGNYLPGGWVLDTEGNLAVTGSHEDSNGIIVGGYVAKHGAANGTVLWERNWWSSFFRGWRAGGGMSIAVGTDGDVAVLGSVRVGVVLDGSYIARFAASDGTLLWEQGPRDWTDRNNHRAIAIDSADNVVATGYNATGFDVCEALICYPSRDYQTVKYAAEDGEVLWDQRYNGPTGGDDYLPGYPNDFRPDHSHQLLLVGPDDPIVITGLSESIFGWRHYEIATVKYVMTQVTYPTPVALSVALSSEGARLRFTSDAGRTYRLQRASDPAGPWTTFAALTAPPNGAIEHLDPAPIASSAFYRIAAP